MRVLRRSFLSLLPAVILLCAGWGGPALAQPGGEEGLVTRAAAPNIYLYDMGSDTSAVWGGFARIGPATAYDAQRGHGWVLPQGSNPRASVSDYLDALAADCISDAADGFTMEFRQDLPDGDYEVWVLTGTHSSMSYLLHPHALLLQGREASAIPPRRDEVFRAVKYEWSKGDDMYDQFVAPRFRWLHGEAAVTDGRLIIGFTNAKHFPVCAIVIADRAAAARAEEEIVRIERQRKAAFHGLWEAVPVKSGVYADAASEKERARGYIVSEVDCLDEVLPGSGPPAGASRSAIELFAAPGEQAQASFAVYAMSDLRYVSYDVGDMRATDGKTLSFSIIERGLVQLAPRHLTDQPPKYDIFPGMILPARPTFIGENTCKQFWMTVRVPMDAAAGVYEGAVRISSLDAEASALRLRLRVLPFRLATPPVERFFYFGGLRGLSAQMTPWGGEEYWESIRAETRYLKDNEFFIAQFKTGDVQLVRDKNGRVVDVDLSTCEKLMSIVKEENAWPRDNAVICRDFGDYFGGYWREGGEERGIKFAPTPEDRADCIRTVQIIVEKARKAGWPEIVFEVGGESSNWGKQGAEFATAVHSAFKEAGVRNALRGNGAEDMEVIAKGLLDYPVPACWLMTEKWFPTVKANAKRLWAYGFSTGRFGMGWFCYKHGISRACIEPGIYFHGQPGNIFDDRSLDAPNGGLPTSLTSLAPSVCLKRMVEGANDLKYLYTLDGLIRKAEASGKPPAQSVARAARAWLEERLKSIPEYADKAIEGGRDIRLAYSVDRIAGWQGGDLNKYRWQMAEFIMALNGELGEQP